MIQICGVPVRSEVNAIWLPVGDQVGVTSIVGMIGQPAQAAAVAVDDVDLRVAVAVRHERELRAVGRPGRQKVLLVRRSRCAGFRVGGPS